MVFFYALHNFIEEIPDNLPQGKRNCKTVLIGGLMYIVAYVIVANLRLSYGKVYDAVLTGLIMMFMLDVATMGWIYKDYYGRSIIHEINDDSIDGYVYNTDEHRYKKKYEDEDMFINGEVTPSIIEEVEKTPIQEHLDKIELERQVATGTFCSS